MSKFRFNTSIKSYETDALGKVSLANLFYFFQEAANLHASSLEWGLEYLDSINKFWVLSRLFVKIDNYPVHKDEICIETWSRGAEGFFAYRDYRVLANGKSCIDAVSSWMILDKSTHRPAKIEQIGKEVPGIIDSYITLPSHKIPTVTPINKTFEKTINFSDIDINLHVNNGKYVEILCDSLAGKLMSGSVVESLDIQYMSESQLGDNILVYQSETDPSNIHLSMVNSTKSKETCRCHIQLK